MKTRLNNIKIRAKDVFCQWINFIIHQLSAINLWLNNDCNPNPKGYEDLTPTDDGDKDKKYSEALEWALRNKRIKNIALTGAYGSGKSSILRTFEKEHKGYNYLNISLASFTDSEVNDSDDRENSNIDRLIELSILQQMFYHVKHKSVPDSRFKRIKGLKGKRLLLKSLKVIIWLMAILLLWQPKFIQSITIWKDYNNISNRNLDFVLLTIVLYGLGVIISKSIRIANNAKLNKLNIQSGEIEISENIDSSILNKHLDEILYFFEVTTYNVVIIEDLDRFNNTDIFTKLRELNILINNSRQINRRIIFIYAIKDDMFRDKNRTKFFDFIIPVIPVINITNSGDMLHNKLRNNDSENTISTNFIDDVSMYIDDMRLLKNICNEYAIYKEKLSPKLHYDNLLAMIIYKNIFPSDFVDLHNGKGKVFSVFDNKLTLINGRIDNINTEIEACREKIKEVEDTCINYIQELRAIYIYAIIEKLSSIYSFYINNTEYDFSTIKEDEPFETLQKTKKIGYYQNQYDSYRGRWNNVQLNSNFSFSDIEKGIDANNTYRQREQLITDKQKNKIEELKKHIEELKLEKNEIKFWTLQQVVEKIGFGNSIENIKNEKLIIYLIRNGYINEDYHDYISYFHEGLITKGDREFRFSILNREPLPFDYKLTKVENLIKKIRLKEFEYKEVLNCSLVDFLFPKKEIYIAQYQVFLKQLCNKSKSAVAFIDYYIEKGKTIDNFIEILCKEWNSFWDFIVLESGYSTDRKDIYLKLIVEHVDLETIKQLDENLNITNYLSDKVDFLDVFTDEPNIRKIIKTLNIKFKSLLPSKKRNHLFDFIYKSDLYEVNLSMIEFIIKAYSSENLATLKTANYTTIQMSKCENLINYIDENLNQYISTVFLTIPENTDEAEESVIDLLNKESVTLEQKKDIIEKQNCIISDLSKIDETESDLMAFIVQKSKMQPIWENVIFYFKYKEDTIDAELTLFLNQERNYEELAKTKLKEETTKVVELENSFIINNEITDACFKSLLNCFLYIYSNLDFEHLSEKKIDLMIIYGYLKLSVDRFDYLKEHFTNHINLLEHYSSEFITHQIEYSLDEDDILQILSSQIFSQKQKIFIIQNVDENLVIDNKDLSSRICDILSSYQYIELQFNVLNSLIKYGRSLENKLKLFLIQFDKLSHEQITNLLNKLGGHYSEIAINGKRPSLQKTSLNIELIDKLKEIGYISSSTEKEETIKVNTKNG